jgi:hypothetical protein
MNPAKRWRVGELAEQAGLTVRALYHYDHLVCCHRPCAPPVDIGTTRARTWTSFIASSPCETAD